MVRTGNGSALIEAAANSLSFRINLSGKPRLTDWPMPFSSIN